MRVIKSIQEKLGVKADGVFGRISSKALQQRFNLSNEHAAHFLGQCHHESGGFRIVIENLNYSAEALRRTWPNRFDILQAKYYANKPEQIANKVYASRMGNGSELTGDGWKHRGMGFIQLTGKNNQYAFADWIGDQRIKDNPELIAIEYPLDSARFFFDTRSIWRFCDVVNDESILNVSKIINVGNVKSKIVPNGMDDRINQTKKYYQWLTS
jgi:putative chitinase